MSSMLVKLHRTIIGVFIFVLMTNHLFAGTTGKISGRVTDAETGEGLPGVNVILENTGMGASTDIDGIYFIINVPVGIFSVRAEMIGYNSSIMTEVSVRGDLTTEVDFPMTIQVLESDQEVIVVAERPMVQKDLTSGRSIVSAAEISEMPVESLAGVIGTKAGIVAGADGSMHIRGGRSSEVTYMIDGVPVTNLSSGGLAVGLENSAVQELQILSGTFNAEYGQAMSGIINIVTKEGGEKYQGNISAYMGDYYTENTRYFEHADEFDPSNIKNLELSLSGPVPGFGKKLTFFANGRAYNYGGLYRGVREHSPNDVNYLTSKAVEELRDSPWGRAGLLNFAEPFTDLDADGKLAPGSESYFDFDGNGQFTVGEPFRDVNGNGRYDHNIDFNQNGFIDNEDWEFIDLNGDGVLNGDPFVDANFNGVLDGEPYIDFNGNQMWDSGATGDSSIVRLNTSSRVNGMLKLTWKINPKLKLNASIIHNIAQSQSYSQGYKYNPDGRPTNESTSTSIILDLRHSLNARMFYNIKGSYYQTTAKTYYIDVDPTKLSEDKSLVFNNVSDWADFIDDAAADDAAGIGMGSFYGSVQDSLLILKSDMVISFHDSLIVGGVTMYAENIFGSNSFSIGVTNTWESTAGPSWVETLSDPSIIDWIQQIKFDFVINDLKKAYFLPNEISEQPDNEYLAGGHSHSFSERINRTYLMSADLTWQMNNTHQVKAGVGFKTHTMEYKAYTVFVQENLDWIPTIKTTESSFSNDSYDNWLTDAVSKLSLDTRNPREAYVYLQDKIELKDMIVNLGLRYDYFNPNYFVPSDYRDPENPTYWLYTLANPETANLDTFFQFSGEVTAFDEILDTLDANGEPWKEYNDFYVDTEPVHQISPRIGVAYPITDKGIIHFSYGHFFQIPTFSYLYANPEMEISTASNESILGNANLKPQKTVTYEIGLQQELTSDLGIEIIAFYKDFSGLLSSDQYEKYNTVKYIVYSNRDYGDTKGITFSINKRRSGLLSASADYTYLVAQGNASNPLALFYANQSDPPAEVVKQVIPLDWDQTHTINVNISLSQPRKWGISILTKYGSGLPYTPTYQGSSLDAANSDRRPDFFNVDINMHKDVVFAGLHWTVFAKIYNALNIQNERSVFSDTGRATYSLIPTYTPDRGNIYGRHSLADWLTRPNYFSSPRQFRVGFSTSF
ncbi:MAG: TonB-dependent receptor [Candidatus Marinimicrobia bacterium]|nr:TonB-dependent receptor [Candidatus Neomarinimicrobiota bacterium]